MDNMQKMVAECIGTFTLVFIGCGAAILGLGDVQAGGVSIGLTGIAFAFGLALIGMAYSIGPISGCHINPAVSLGAFLAGRMSMAEMLQYWIAQVAGALIAAVFLSIIINGSAFYDGGSNLGSNGFGAGYLGEYGVFSAFVFEFVATFLFVTVILGATTAGSSIPASMAGLVIGLALVAIHLAGIQVTGVSVNPARSIGPAIVSGNGAALLDLWLFILAPALGAALAGFLFRGGFMGSAHPAAD